MISTLEKLCGHEIQSGRVRPFKALFSLIAGAAHSVNVNYALCGPMAMGIHGRARMVAGPDILVPDNDLEPFLAYLDGDSGISRRDGNRIGFSIEKGIRLPFWLYGVRTELGLSAITLSRSVRLFGISVPVTPKHLVFSLLAMGDMPRDKIDAGMMLADEPDILRSALDSELGLGGYRLRQMQERLEDLAEQERGRDKALLNHLESQARRRSRKSIACLCSDTISKASGNHKSGARYG